ncbi:MAG: hypothetical protein ACPKPY_06685 [Nitrososphaeraceae archaeon]
MPTSPKSRTIGLRVSLTEKLKKKHKDELKKSPTKTNKDFGGYVNDLLANLLERDDFLNSYNPNISVIDISNNILYLKDGKRTIEIFPKNNELYCSYDDSFDCKHIKYSFAIPEVSKLDLKNSI